jgi:hypothetical protein
MKYAMKTANVSYRFAMGLALVAALVLVWVKLGVGIIGDPEDAANLMYGGVLAVGVVGAIVARLRPSGMARVLLVTALAQVLVAVIAVMAGWGSTGPVWPRDVCIATAFFAVLWLTSAGLFQRAARVELAAGAEATG